MKTFQKLSIIVIIFTIWFIIDSNYYESSIYILSLIGSYYIGGRIGEFLHWNFKDYSVPKENNF